MNALCATRLGAAALLGATLAACSADPRLGYSTTTTFPASVRTVAVPVFENNTYDPGVELELTEAIIKELQRSTGLRVVQSGPADSTLRGVVTATGMQRLSTQRDTGLTQELGVTVTIDFDWKDNRSGKLLVSRRQFAASDTFAPARPSVERRETGRHGAVSRLAQDVVGELRSEW